MAKSDRIKIDRNSNKVKMFIKIFYFCLAEMNELIFFFNAIRLKFAFFNCTEFTIHTNVRIPLLFSNIINHSRLTCVYV